ncbi:MAG TPA: hypothetical protein VEC99_14530, partial [Clostridia bacterium]|nr:hypothetical protein [Clostridia bacterium]
MKTFSCQIARLGSRLSGEVPSDPFYSPRKPLWLPKEMAEAPQLEEPESWRPVEKRYALLINPFYPKSPHGSFG